MSFQNLESRMAPLPERNVDTDQIIPARFLTTTTRYGLGQHLFGGRIDHVHDGVAIDHLAVDQELVLGHGASSQPCVPGAGRWTIDDAGARLSTWALSLTPI